MYQATQNTMSDHIIVDPDRDQKKMEFLKKELYMKHECRNYLAELSNCQKSKDFCFEEALEHRICI
jgi:hypothetical protein